MSIVFEGKGNLRQQTLLSCLDRIIEHSDKKDVLNVIEVGCMFKEDEGLSTYSIAKRLDESGRQFRFATFDIDQAHLDSCRTLIGARDPTLVEKVEFVYGNSVKLLPHYLRRMQSVHFAFLDGSGNPGICLKEFEMVSNVLAATGLCLVDDVSEMQPTEYYSTQRTFGKGTLILPLLIVSEYMRHKTEPVLAPERPMRPDEEAMVLNLVGDSISGFAEMSYRMVSKKGSPSHGLLLYGDEAILDQMSNWDSVQEA